MIMIPQKTGRQSHSFHRENARTWRLWISFWKRFLSKCHVYFKTGEPQTVNASMWTVLLFVSWFLIQGISHCQDTCSEAPDVLEPRGSVHEAPVSADSSRKTNRSTGLLTFVGPRETRWNIHVSYRWNSLNVRNGNVSANRRQTKTTGDWLTATEHNCESHLQKAWRRKQKPHWEQMALHMGKSLKSGHGQL